MGGLPPGFPLRVLLARRPRLRGRHPLRPAPSRAGRTSGIGRHDRVPALLGGRPMTPAQIRALELGCNLDQHNELIQHRARMAATPTNRPAPLPPWLLPTPRLLATRPGRRGQLAEALAEVE